MPDDTSKLDPVRIRAALIFGACAIVLAVGAYLWLGRSRVPEGVVHAIVGSKRVLVLGRWDRRPPGGQEWVRPDDVPGLRAALRGESPKAVSRILVREGIDAVLVSAAGRAEGAPEGTVEARLRGMGQVSSFRGRVFDEAAHVYGLADTLKVNAHLEQSLALVTRSILAGHEPPGESLFPAALSTGNGSEVLVTLRRGNQAVLWRSARDTSMARALITAASAARRRWNERAAALGGPLSVALPRLTVTVDLLVNDGDIDTRAAAFMDAAVAPNTGIGYEGRGAWRYVLPEAVAQDGHGATKALVALMHEDGLPADAYRRPELRVYRVVLVPVAESAPESTSDLPSLTKPDPSSSSR